MASEDGLEMGLDLGPPVDRAAVEADHARVRREECSGRGGITRVPGIEQRAVEPPDVFEVASHAPKLVETQYSAGC